MGKRKQSLQQLVQQLSRPAEGIEKTNKELSAINEKLHNTNKRLLETLQEILTEFNERLGCLEVERFGKVRGDFDKFLEKQKQEEEADVQVQDVRGIDPSQETEAETTEASDERGPEDGEVADGDPGGNSRVS